MWNSFSAHASLLGFLEQTPIDNSLNFSLAPFDNYGANTTGRDRIIGVFICPSDPNAGTGHQDVNSYASSFGSTTDDLYDWNNAGQGANTNSQIPHGSGGMFTFGMAYGLRDCTAGSSNTVAFSEWVVGDGRGTYYGNSTPRSTYRDNGIMTVTGNNPTYQNAAQNSAAVPAGLQACATQFMTPGAVTVDYKGWKWAMGSSGFSMFNTIQTPNDSLYAFGVCRFGGTPNDWPDNSTFVGAASAHPGGVNTLMADGSVKFVKNSINRLTWWSLGTRNGGEIVGSDDY